MSANNIRSYFPVRDPVTDEILEAFCDLSRSENETTVNDWGVFYDRTHTIVNETVIYSGGRSVQPAWLLLHVEAQRQIVRFTDDNGIDNVEKIR